MSLALPLEVIERVIDHSADSTKTLYSFALTCRDLRPRSTILLFCHIKPKTRNQLFDLCALLKTNPHLRPCVRSVSIRAVDFSPHPLLRILPNLSQIHLDDAWPGHDRPLTFHASLLKYCHQFGQHLRALSLAYLVFPSPSAFSDILLSFSKIESLSCGTLSIKNNNIHPEHTIRRLSEQLRLKTLTIRGFNNDAVLTLLREAAKRSLTTLFCIVDHVRHEERNEKLLLGSPSDWVQLSSLTWEISCPSTERSSEDWIQDSIEVLKNFRPPKLREVTATFSFYNFRELVIEWLPPVSGLCAELEETLMTFPQPTISFSPGFGALNVRRYHSWMHMLERFFPVLAGRHALRIDAEYCPKTGHDLVLSTPIVISSDSRWAATGSSDGTIIIWDVESRCVSREWFAEEAEGGVESLTLSPDGRYIMSANSEAAARGEAATIWDFHQGVRLHTLMAEGGDDGDRTISCAWSPDGSWIAAGPQGDGAVHVWETTTFQRLHFHGTAWKGKLLAYSADGRWVITAAYRDLPHGCWIWDVESGKLHQSFRGHTDWVRAASFNQEHTHVVTGSGDSTIRVWKVETGEQLLILEEQATRQIDAVAFLGPDGRMVLSHSSVLEHSYNNDATTDDGSGGVKVWDLSRGDLLASLSETRHHIFRRAAHTACLSPCGSYVVSASDEYDSIALLWRTSDWSCIAEFSDDVAPGVNQIAISPDGRVLCCGTGFGTVFFRRMHDLVSADQDCSRIESQLR